MKFTSTTVLLLIAVAGFLDPNALVDARKPSRSATSSSSRRGPPSRSGGGSRSGRPSSGRSSASRKRYVVEEEEEDDFGEDDFGFPDEADLDEEEDDGMVEEDDYGEDEMEDEEEEEEIIPRRRPSSSKRPSNPRRSAKPSSRGRPSGSGGGKRQSRYADEDDNYGRPSRPTRGGRAPPPSSRGRRPAKGGRGGRVVPYTRKPQQPSTFVRGFDAIRNSIPDASYVREAAAKSLSVARETTSSLSTNLYREVKGLTSSELEQVMLKATRPDDTPVKGKHVERLVGVTYQISSRYDIYDAVLRKLWSKMSEKDWRTNMKALYILHRFSADGAPEHAPALKARLRELRRTRDPKRKEKYFNSKQLMAGDDSPAVMPFKAYMSRYAHYVLLRAQCFAGMFDEIATPPAPPASDRKSKKPSSTKPITSTCLKQENYDAAALLIKAGVACQLRKGEECEHTAIATERVCADLMKLCGAVATSLTRVLSEDDLKGADPAIIQKWCELYSEKLLPQTKAMVKKTSPKLDKFGLFLPSRMGASLSQDLLQKGLNLEASGPESVDEIATATAAGGDDKEDAVEDAKAEEPVAEAKEEATDDVAESRRSSKEAEYNDAEEQGDEYDEYEYDEEEYYDDEEPF